MLGWMYTSVSLFLGGLFEPSPIYRYGCIGQFPFWHSATHPRSISTMHSPKALHTLTAVQVHRLLKADNITVEEYAHSILARIKERDHIVKAWEYLGMV